MPTQTPAAFSETPRDSVKTVKDHWPTTTSSPAPAPYSAVAVLRR